ncbi:Far upstream element-binding protein 3 [Erysiphe neolycopersici]|uniref:Far upstream element-binding protein 3 n=1 Tax=Erysiphe neolycopersici TaxID=212602 RepID=A0A420HHK7_9PEZI|nr:Far upstream element-binding protein 3 [Erysiphe neolycopersici]
MAEQPSISSILAALAAQRPNPITPASTQQPPYQQPPQSLPNSYGHPVGYSLPQPTNSGSVDLSNIKPVSSGSMSITDAIAKAREIAAQKGVSYDRPTNYAPQQDQRLSNGRLYGASRSRSRSPAARRDAFRDNLNPYRDERRIDRNTAGRDYRERSFSPGPRGRVQSGGFSPAQNSSFTGQDRSPPRGFDDNSESLSIETNLVGLIIGRSGENLRRVEADSGCRVQFITGPEEAGPFRQCRISGSRASRMKAKAEINRIIDDSGMVANSRAAAERMKEVPPGRSFSHQPALRDGEDSMQIMVPDKTVGLIIGRGGETIRDLQERSGCHVNIVGEQKSVNGLRPVNLIGSREAADRAKDLIMEIVESDSKNSSGKDRVLNQRDQHRDSGISGNSNGFNLSGGEKISESIFVPSDAVGMIIGKGGETIKDIQSTTTCKINVSPQSGPGEVEREIGLVGTRASILAARRAIEEKVEAVAQKNGSNRARAATYNDFGDRNYNQHQHAQHQSHSTPIHPSNITGAEDPYAAYGGYQNYLALWYQAIAQQQQQQQQGIQSQRDLNKPPGTS